MLSAFILSERSYPAMPLTGQLEHQRFVRSNPLVLGSNPLKYPTLRQCLLELLDGGGGDLGAVEVVEVQVSKVRKPFQVD